MDYFDPIDIMRGRFIRLKVMGNIVKMHEDSTLNFTWHQTVYATIKRNSSGLGKYDRISANRPNDELYLTVKFSDAYHQNAMTRRTNLALNPGNVDDSLNKFFVTTISPIRRFYLDERNADIVDSCYVNMGKTDMFIDVRILDGYPVVEEFYFEDTPLKEYLENLDK